MSKDEALLEQLERSLALSLLMRADTSFSLREDQQNDLLLTILAGSLNKAQTYDFTVNEMPRVFTSWIEDWVCEVFMAAYNERLQGTQ